MSKISIAQVTQDAAFNTAIQAAAGTGTLRVVSTAYAATVTPNADTTDVLMVGSLTGSLTLANPSGTLTEMQAMVISLPAITADRTVTLGGAYLIPSSATFSSPFVVAAASETILAIRWSVAQSKWRVVSYVLGY